MSKGGSEDSKWLMLENKLLETKEIRLTCSAELRC